MVQGAKIFYLNTLQHATWNFSYELDK